VNTFSFAWEDNSYTNALRAHANETMDETDVLVIIGYSFPSFNRNWDLTLLRQFISNKRQVKTKRVVVQSKSMKEETFKHLVRMEADGIPIMVESDLTQFYVPPEFFDKSLAGEWTPA
jgi:thiamine pyrophosphate-dependent acetolactate synthase large subunit-like protein